MRWLKIILMAGLGLVVPGFPQIVAGQTVLGVGLYGLFFLSALIFSHTEAVWVGTVSILLVTLSVPVSVIVFALKRQFVLSRRKSVAIFLLMFVANAATLPMKEFKTFSVPSASMVPTVVPGEVVMARKIAADQVKRGDLVVFKLPSDTRVDYVKRVVGLPGETIQLVKGKVLINGVALEQQENGTYQDEAHHLTLKRYQEEAGNGRRYELLKLSDDRPLENTVAVTVPPGSYFMLGDNRDNSQDSRMATLVGFVPASNLEYRVLYVIRPWPHAIDQLP